MERWGGGGSKSYVWKRGVLAGTERSDPLDVIAKDRNVRAYASRRGTRVGPRRRLERRGLGADKRGFGAETGDTAAAGYVESPGRSWAPHEIVGGAHLFFYLTALVATSSRSILGDGPPAPMPGMERALEVPPPPEAIVGTAAGEAWSSGVERFR